MQTASQIPILMSLTRPLNVLPNLMAQILQARVTLERLSAFSEVDSLVKQPPSTTPPDSISIALATLGITGGAHFMWNSVERPDPDPKITIVTPADNESKSTKSPVDEWGFEPKDIDIIFLWGR